MRMGACSISKARRCVASTMRGSALPADFSAIIGMRRLVPRTGGREPWMIISIV